MLLLFSAKNILAQPKYFPVLPKEKATTKRIEILKTDSLLYNTLELGRFRKLIGNVQLKHDNAYMYCDSAIIDIDANYLTAYGHIYIKKGDSIEMSGNFLEYFGDLKLARLSGDTRLRDKTMLLNTPQLEYDMNTDIGNFKSGGNMQIDSTNLTSAIGYYNHKTSEAFFYGDVVLVNPTTIMYADSMKYNTNTKMVYFITKTKIINRKDKNVIITNSGYFDTQKDQAYFGSGTKITKEKQTIEADNIQFDNKTKNGFANGNVIWKDTAENVTVLSNTIIYKEKSTYIKAYNDPLMINVSEDKKDTLFISSDTMISYQIAQKDSNKIADSIRLLYGYYNVKIMQKNMSAICDSLFFSYEDSIFKLYKSPIMWIDSTQIFGDSIFMFMKNKKIDKIQIMNNGFIAQIQDSVIFNQMKGKNIFATIQNEKINTILVDGNAESIYFIKDDKEDAYIGVNKSVSGEIFITFKDDKIDRLKLTNAPNAEFNPMKNINPENLKLDGFKWNWTLKPKDKYDIIRNRKLYDKYIFESQNMIQR